MATIVQITLVDQGDGLVEVETTVTGADEKSSALALASRLCDFMAAIAEEKQAPVEIPSSLYVGKEFLAPKPKQLVLAKA